MKEATRSNSVVKQELIVTPPILRRLNPGVILLTHLYFAKDTDTACHLCAIVVEKYWHQDRPLRSSTSQGLAGVEAQGFVRSSFQSKPAEMVTFDWSAIRANLTSRQEKSMARTASIMASNINQTSESPSQMTV